jgi:hypothetical protein
VRFTHKPYWHDSPRSHIWHDWEHEPYSETVSVHVERPWLDKHLRPFLQSGSFPQSAPQTAFLVVVVVRFAVVVVVVRVAVVVVVGGATVVVVVGAGVVVVVVVGAVVVVVVAGASVVAVVVTIVVVVVGGGAVDARTQ